MQVAPSLAVFWPVLSICVAGLPGQLSFQSEWIIAVRLLWPALLSVLVGAPPTLLPVVALTSIAAAWSHPKGGVVLAFVVAVAIASAMVNSAGELEPTATTIDFG